MLTSTKPTYSVIPRTRVAKVLWHKELLGYIFRNCIHVSKIIQQTIALLTIFMTCGTGRNDMVRTYRAGIH